MLRRWLEQSGEGPRVFDIVTSFNTAWPHVLERAGIMKFRWHDLRHHFASRLVQVGVPLNTARDLLGHSSVAMSLRYAHLAPDRLIVHQEGGTAGPRLFNQLAQSVVNMVRRTPRRRHRTHTVTLVVDKGDARVARGIARGIVNTIYY